jgi:hypothetical protein
VKNGGEVMNIFTIKELSQIMDLKLRNLGDLVGIKIVVEIPESDTYGITVMSFRINPKENELTLHGQIGETVRLRRISEISWFWEFMAPEQKNLEIGTNISFYF